MTKKPAGRPPGSDDPDWLFLDNNISLAEQIRDLVEKIKDVCDDPDVLQHALDIEGRALIVQHRTRLYRPRMKKLKESRRRNGKQK